MSVLEKYLKFLTYFFFLYVPMFYLANRLLGLPLTFPIVLATFVVFFGATPLFKRHDFSFRFNSSLLREHWPLILILTMFVMTHAVNYYYYQFIPEWDSYAKLLEIEKVISSGNVEIGYRGFFTAAVSIISKLTAINPYYVFSILLTGLQSTIFIVFYLLFKEYDIKNKLTQFLLLLLPLSVPVLNMEIDMTRPQNIFIAFFPVYIYFFVLARRTGNPLYWFLSILIALGGLNYHEFFAILAATHAIWIIFLILKKYLVQGRTSQDKIIAGLSLALAVTLSILLTERIGALRFMIDVMQKMLDNITVVENWRLWFLGSYNTDGPRLDIGWSGVTGIIKYYAYYMSPAIFAIVVAFAYSLLKNTHEIVRDKLVQAILPILLIALSFSELLPRMNFLFYPERFWILTDMALLLAAIVIVSRLTNTVAKYQKHAFIGVIIIFFIIGLGGSFYVAKAKSSLTSPEEYEAAQWIRANTPSDSVFITQGGNIPMIGYFSRRDAIIPVNSSYFLSDKIQEVTDKRQRIRQHKEKVREEITQLTLKMNNSNKVDFTYYTNKLNQLISKFENLNAGLMKLPTHDVPRYILYSEHKLKGLYTQRQWWLDANFSGANIEKFNRTYPLVYSEDGVFIWKVK